MKKYKAIATQAVDKNSTKKVTSKKEYKSYKFTFLARNFNEAWEFAEKEAKRGMSLFTALKVIKL